MKRRDLLQLAGASLAATVSGALAQSRAAPRRIGMLSSATPEFSKPQHDAFTTRLRELGYAVGRDIQIEARWADGSSARLAALARELVDLKPAVIVAPGWAIAAAVKKETSEIPIVFVGVESPEAIGFVASLARPGGHMTGTTWRGAAMGDKLRELLRETFPAARRVAMLWLDDPLAQKNLPGARERMAAAGFELEVVMVKGREEYASAFTRIVNWRAEIFYPSAAPLFIADASELGERAAKARLPMVGARRAFTDAGGLLSFDNDLKDDFRRAASYVDRILKGAKPADLPVEQPDRFHMVVNLRTAKALGIKVPQSVLLRADQVIE